MTSCTRPRLPWPDPRDALPRPQLPLEPRSVVSQRGSSWPSSPLSSSCTRETNWLRSRGWVALVAYVRAAVIVAFVDGLGAGIGAAIIGSSMSVAIGALTFILAFVPIVGALTAGVVAVGVVLVTLGFFKAVIMLIVFVAVMQIEGHVLQPFLLGKAVSIHPLIVLVGIAVGAIISGIVGALFAIPIVAFGVAFIKALSPETPTEEVPPSQDDLAAEHA